MLVLVEMDKSNTPKILGGSINIEGRDIWVERICKGVLKCKSFDVIWLIKYTTVAATALQYQLGTIAPRSRAWVISNICWFFLSVTPFCCGVWEHDVSWRRLCCWKYAWNLWLMNLQPLSERRIFILKENWIWTMAWKHHLWFSSNKATSFECNHRQKLQTNGC